MTVINHFISIKIIAVIYPGILMQSKPVWVGDLKTSQKIKIVMF